MVQWLDNMCFSHCSTPSYSLIRATPPGRYRTESSSIHTVIEQNNTHAPTQACESIREMSIERLLQSQGVPSHASIEDFSRVHPNRTQPGFDRGYPLEPKHVCLTRQAPQLKSYPNISGPDVYSSLDTHSSPLNGVSGLGCNMHTSDR